MTNQLCLLRIGYSSRQAGYKYKQSQSGAHSLVFSLYILPPWSWRTKILSTSKYLLSYLKGEPKGEHSQHTPKEV